MSAFIYVAKRNLIAGHVVDTQYSFDLAIAKYKPADLFDGHQQTTVSLAETTLNSAIASHKFTTIPLTYIEYLEAREFLSSINDGQLITFDATGTVAVPVNALSGKMKFKKKLSPSQPNYKTYVFDFEILELS